MYLKQNPIVTKQVNGRIKEADHDNRYKEIDAQIKIMNALAGWLPTLEKLRSQSDEKAKVAPRGDIEVNGLFKNKQ